MKRVRPLLTVPSSRSWAYDGAGRVVSLTDGELNETVFGYDDLGRPDSTEFADGTAEQVEFYLEGTGLVSSSTGRDGTTIDRWYDERGRFVSLRAERGEERGVFEVAHGPLGVRAAHRWTANNETAHDAWMGFARDSLGRVVREGTARFAEEGTTIGPGVMTTGTTIGPTGTTIGPGVMTKCDE